MTRSSSSSSSLSSLSPSSSSSSGSMNHQHNNHHNGGGGGGGVNIKNWFSHTDLVNDPLILLRVNERVFNVPILLHILLQILHSYMVASRKHLIAQSQISPIGSTKQEELNTLLYAQDSTILQMLLDICSLPHSSLPPLSFHNSLHLNHPNHHNHININNGENNDNDNGKGEGEGEGSRISQEEDRMDEGDREEIQTNICAFLHQQFIENPLLIKLIHFQTYKSKLVAMMVGGVPSMHICIDFLPELLIQPQIDKQIFAIHLASFIIEKYPIPRW